MKVSMQIKKSKCKNPATVKAGRHHDKLKFKMFPFFAIGESVKDYLIKPQYIG